MYTRSLGGTTETGSHALLELIAQACQVPGLLLEVFDGNFFDLESTSASAEVASAVQEETEYVRRIASLLPEA